MEHLLAAVHDVEEVALDADAGGRFQSLDIKSFAVISIPVKQNQVLVIGAGSEDIA